MSEIITVALEEVRRQIIRNWKEGQEVELRLDTQGHLWIIPPYYRGLPNVKISGDKRNPTALVFIAIIENEEDDREYSFIIESESKYKSYDLCRPTAIEEAVKDTLSYIDTGVLPRKD